MGSRRSSDFGDLVREVGDAVVAEVSRARARTSTDRWRAEQARRHKTATRIARQHRRQREKAERALTRNVVLSSVFAVLAVLIVVVQLGTVPFVVTAGLSLLAGGRAAYWVVEQRRLKALPAPEEPPPLPPAAPRSSQTAPYVQRADRVARSWAALEPLLQSADPVPSWDLQRRGSPRRAPVAGGTAERAQQASAVGRDALGEIHAEIAHVQALEVARSTAPPQATEHLDAAVSAGLGRLETLVSAFEHFVVAASELVQAAQAPPAPGRSMPAAGGGEVAGNLQDATEALAGLAAGLREVRGGGTPYGSA